MAKKKATKTEETAAKRNGTVPEGEIPAFTTSTLTDDTLLEIVLESKYLGIQRTCERHGVNRKTIYLWREKVRTEPALKKGYLAKIESYNRDFSEQISDTLRSQLDYLQRAAQEADPSDRTMVRAIAGALKMVGELNLGLHVANAAASQMQKRLPAPSDTAPAVYEISSSEPVVEGDLVEVTEVDAE
jgi:hypothetical protein